MKKNRIVIEQEPSGIWIAQKQWKASFERKWHTQAQANGMSAQQALTQLSRLVIELSEK